MESKIKLNLLNNSHECENGMKIFYDTKPRKCIPTYSERLVTNIILGYYLYSHILDNKPNKRPA